VDQNLMHEMISNAYATIFYTGALTLPAFAIFILLASLVVINQFEFHSTGKVLFRVEELIEKFSEEESTDNDVEELEFFSSDYLDRIAA
jgi:hypothetical protein